MTVFSALADPTRREIVGMLAKGQQSVGDISRRFDMSAPAISQHLKALRQARLVRIRPEGQRRIYRIDPAGFAELDAWLARIRSPSHTRPEPPPQTSHDLLDGFLARPG
jgi:DNA-binding transcriptional ArsR family regulator